MSLHPVERFLGVPENSTPYVILGLPSEHVDVVMVGEALRRRVGEVFRHPDGRSDEADLVRAVLRDAAEYLKRSMQERRQISGDGAAAAVQPPWMAQAVRSRHRPRPGSVTPFNLTAFDRLVLSVLVACGGWNARSRAQLVALAQTYGVGVQGLLRVMQGLSDYARSGGPRIGVTDIAAKGGPSPIQQLAATAPPPVGPALLDRLADSLGRELKEGGAWPTIRLAIIFGILTIVIGIAALRTVFRSEVPALDGSKTSITSIEPGSGASTRSALTSGTTARPRVTGAARFAKPPTFLGNGLPAEAVNAVDRLPALPVGLDELARKITVADGEPSDAVYRLWADDINTIAMSWTIGDASTRNAIETAIFEVLRAAADTPAVSDGLLKTLMPPSSIAQPLDLWRGAWMAGMLARIASSTELPPVVVDRARNQLEITLSQNLRGSMAFEAAADTWLAQRVPQLVQMLTFDEAAYDTWELWLAAERALGEDDRFAAAIVRALQGVLETDYDLSPPGPAINVAARLLNTALSTKSGMARQRVLDLFDDERIVARDLWVLTSLMANADAAGWFPDQLVVPEDADMPHRWRIRDDLAKAWPAPVAVASPQDADAGRPKIDLVEGDRWASVVTNVLAAPVGRDQSVLMQQIIDASRMNEAAAALVAQSPEEAARVIGKVEQGWVTASPAPPSNPGARPGTVPVIKPRSGQPIGVDGLWAAQYAAIGKNTDARSESLRSLRTNAGTDLGPVDAALLVREAYRGSPQEVRSIAQAVLAEQFRTGPNVAMQLLDQFPEAPATESISEMIQTVGNRLLPGVRSSAWPVEARLALVNHALSLRDMRGAPLDGFIEPLTESYANRGMIARKDASAFSMPLTPQESAEALLRVLASQAEFAAPIDPTPADLPNLQRRHNTRLSLAEGPMQRFVAQQLAILDLMIYITVAEQSTLRSQALEIMREHAAARTRMKDVLEQSLDLERTMLEIWRLRLGFDREAADAKARAENGDAR